MAKKSVAKLKDSSAKNYAKVVIPVKSQKTGAITFREEFVPQDQVKEVLAKAGN